MVLTAVSLDREALASRYLRNRERADAIFDSVRPEAYESRPIPLRNPICFYEGHLPAFGLNTIVKRGLGRTGVDEGLETLFERGIDPEDEQATPPGASAWPSRIEIRSFGAAANRRVLDALAEADIADEANPVLCDGLAVHTVLEHDPMHHETLHYILHRLPFDQKVRPAGLAMPRIGGEPPSRRTVRVAAGSATLGADREEIPFGWDNEFPRMSVDVPAFEIDVDAVTNRDFQEFADSGGYENESFWDEEGWAWRSSHGVRHPLFWELHRGVWMWRGMWDLIPLPMAWPVYVSHAEASAFARWKGKGRRLPSEAEFHRAAYGTPEGVERAHPWGDSPPDPIRGHFDFAGDDPVPVGSYPRGASAWGVRDLVGTGWEWTSTVFAPFPGFAPMPSYPQYSADFFDGKHYVMKGASPATAKELIRRSFRNWFRPTYPYVYAKFRTVGPAS
ncbi:MAG: SUMF1/EgtB/PvdO family nonheme iron enzyme [Thermoanaerobaculia bacterium]